MYWERARRIVRLVSKDAIRGPKSPKFRIGAADHVTISRFHLEIWKDMNEESENFFQVYEEKKKIKFILDWFRLFVKYWLELIKNSFYIPRYLNNSCYTRV